MNRGAKGIEFTLSCSCVLYNVVCFSLSGLHPNSLAQIKQNGVIIQRRSCLYAKYASAYKNFLKIKMSFLYLTIYKRKEKRKLKIRIDEMLRQSCAISVSAIFFNTHPGVLYYLFQSKKLFEA